MERCEIEDRDCSNCGECDQCDLNNGKTCNDCGLCIQASEDYLIRSVGDLGQVFRKK